jgi:hypothetical protein
MTVKPVYNGHPWGLTNMAVRQRCLIKLRFRLAVDDSNWPLLTGGRCSQVVVRSGLTVFDFFLVKKNSSHSLKTDFRMLFTNRVFVD